MEKQYHILTPVPTYESLVPKRFSAYSMSNFTHSIGRRPNKNIKPNPIDVSLSNVNWNTRHLTSAFEIESNRLPISIFQKTSYNQSKVTYDKTF